MQSADFNIDPHARAIADAVEEAIVTRTLDNIVMACNRGAERMLGYAAAEIIGKPASLFIPAERKAEETALLERVRRGEHIEFLHTQRRRKSGELFNAVVTLHPIRDDIGQPIGMLEIAKDLTEVNRLEKAERDQLLLSSIVSSADDAIISKDLNGIVTSWNTAAQSLFGYTAEEMIGRSVDKLIPPGHAEEEPQILRRIRRGERIDHYETQRARKDGRILDISLTVSPIRDRMGVIVGASKIARDISDRKRWEKAEAAESFLGALIDSAEDAIISKDLNGVVTSWNPAAQRLFGYTADEMIGKSIVILIPRENVNEEPNILQKIRRGERIEHYETKRVRKDGSIIDIALTISPIRDSLGRIIGASKIARDITQQKQNEMRERDALRQAQEARRLAEQASRAKDEFLATVSHELRTPMTAILGWTRMLMTGHINAELQRRAVETIERNARAQAQLVEDLLDVSRIVSGKLRIDFKAVDFAVVVAAAVDAVRPSAEAKGIHLQTVMEMSSAPVLGDSDRLQQVVWNLLSNAIKFTPDGGYVRAEVRKIDSSAELRVVDNGSGIHAEFLPHIFERFTQADTSITRTHGGLGMGLAIVKSLVELHGGMVSASSPGENQGATFTVRLPISTSRALVKAPSNPKPTLDASIKEHAGLVGLKILVIDDEPDTCELLTYVFDECGAIVQTAHNASEGLRLFDTWKPDILVSDIGMPGVDGYELIRTIRNERRSRIPAVALTAMARINDRVKALTAGYQMHVAKPIEPSELISIVGGLADLVNRRSAV